MDDRFIRMKALVGEEAMRKLADSRVIVFGIGGVGSYALEALVRSGIGAVDAVDCDVVSESNINRQIIALSSTVGLHKCDVARERMLDISPDLKFRAHPIRYGADTAETIDLGEYDYVIDAIDTVTAKLLLIERAKAVGTPIISAMGTGNKLDPTALKVADIYSTSTCPLARIMRKELKKRGVESLKVVYSDEEPIVPDVTGEVPPEGRRSIPASAAFVPSAAGMILAAEVVKDLIK